MLYIADRVFEDMPRMTGLPLVRHGRQWWGACRIGGESHPRRDKLKVYIWNGRVWLHEEGGDTMGVDRWMVQYGGMSEREACMILRGDGSYWAPPVRKVSEDCPVEVRYVGKDVLDGMSRFPLESCPLFRWMCRMWDEDMVRDVWRRYGVTTDTFGRAVFWYVDGEGRVLYDKRIMYGADGHRRKDRTPGREYKVDDGYTGRCLFGAAVRRATPDTEVCVVESEKTALVMACAEPERKWVATGGKSNVSLAGESMVLYPDLDAVDRWRKTGLEIREWWTGWDNADKNADVADMVVERFGSMIK